MDLTPDILRTFRAAAQTLNFTLAARRVNLTQSAVSMQIRKLETHFGKTFFTRIPRGVELTEDGASLLKYANRLLDMHTEALASLAAREMTGTIRVGAAEDHAALHMPGILRRFAEKYPRIQVDLFCDLSNDLVGKLDQGEIDICLVNTGKTGAGGVFLRKEPVVWIGPADNEPERKQPLPLALFHSGCIYRGWAIRALEEKGISYRVAYSSPSISGILAAVRSGLAVAPVGAGTPLAGCRIIPPTILPPLPSADVCLHQSPCPESSAQAELAKDMVEAFSVLRRVASEFRSAG